MGPQVATQNELVDELIARVKFFHIIQVNGTPASGKTTLKNLMVNKLLEWRSNNTRLYRFRLEDEISSQCKRLGCLSP